MTLNPEFRNEHDASSFPFSDRATLVNSSGVRLPTGLFLDLLLYPAGEHDTLYLSKISILTAETARIYFGDSAQADLVWADIDLFEPPEISQIVDSAGRTAGVLVSDSVRLSVLQTWALGDYEFEPAQTEIVAACQLPQPATSLGVTSLQGISQPLWLVGHKGVILQTEERVLRLNGSARTVQVITVNAVGEPNFKQAACAPELYEQPRFLRKVVFQTGQKNYHALPNARGDIQLTGAGESDTVLRVTPTAEGLSLRAVGQPLGTYSG